jgi:hypothetical protein
MKKNKSFVFIMNELFFEFVVFLDANMIKSLISTCKKMYSLYIKEYKRRCLATKLTRYYLRDDFSYDIYNESQNTFMTPKDHIELSDISKDIEPMSSRGHFYVNADNIVDFFEYRKTVSHPVYRNLRYYDGENKENTKKFLNRIPLMTFAAVAKYLTPLEARIIYLLLYRCYINGVYSSSLSEFLKIAFAFHSDIRILIGNAKKFKKFIKKYPDIKKFTRDLINYNMKDIDVISRAEINTRFKKIFFTINHPHLSSDIAPCDQFHTAD